MIGLGSLKHFAATAEIGSISRAADTLNISQPGLSKSLQTLEFTLDTLLFVRGRRGMELTASGHALYRRAKLLLSQWDDAVLELRAIERGALGCLKLGVGPAWPPASISLALAGLARQFPGLHFRVTNGLNDSLLELLQAGELDICAIALPPEISGLEIEVEEILRDELCFVTRQSGAMSGDRLFSIDELLEHDWALPSPTVSSRRQIEATLRSRNLRQPRVLLESNSARFIIEFLKCSDAVGVLSDRVLERPESTGLIRLRVDLEADLARSVGVAYHSEDILSPPARLFLQTIRAQRSEQAALSQALDEP